MDGSSFGAGSSTWLDRLGNLRNVVRQEVVRRQLVAHRPSAGAAVLDVGAGQGTQAVALATAGHRVVALEPDPAMRDACTKVLAGQPAEVATRVEVRAGGLADLDAMDETFPLVLCHGVLMYLDSPDEALAALARRVAPGGALSVVTRNDKALAWRPAARCDWAAVLAALAEQDSARDEGRDATYVNELGVPARADSVEHLTHLLAGHGLTDSTWFGVRIATDGAAVDAPVPLAAELAALLDAEEALGRTEPYRRMGTLFRLVARRSG